MTSLTHDAAGGTKRNAECGDHLIAVAFSGGRDSTALLHCTLRQAEPLGLTVLALHVNHGLMPQADEWERHARLRCAEWTGTGARLQFVCERILEHPEAGDSIEAWARRVRYAALRRMALAAGCTVVLLAHHRRDQAETFLLQALRGAGVNGLASMPAAVERETVHWLRPWLQHSRSAVDAYVEHHRLDHIDDPSNTDPRHARSRLRRDVWPVLLSSFPQAEHVLADAASRVADAAQCLAELADEDLACMVGPGGELLMPPWQLLSPARRRNALRCWLQRCAGRPAPAALVERLMRELPLEASLQHGGRHWDWDGLLLHLQRGSLGMRERRAIASAEAVPREATLRIDSPGRHALPGWQATLVVEAVPSHGIPLARLAEVELRSRTGGEQFQLGQRRPARSLKKQFQAAGVARWSREGALLYSAGELVFVAGLGIDARALVTDGEDLMQLRWEVAGDRAADDRAGRAEPGAR